ALAMTAALALGLRRGRHRIAVVPAELAAHWRAIWTALLVFVGICLLGPMDISIRHFSVPLVLLILTLALLPRLIERLAPAMRQAAWAAVIVIVASSLITA